MNTKKTKLLAEVEQYISDNETGFCGIEDPQAYLNFLFTLTAWISTEICIDGLEDGNEIFWQATKNWYTIILSIDVLGEEIESEEDYVNYILELEEEAGKINLTLKN